LFLELSEIVEGACFEVKAFYDRGLAHSPRSRSEGLNMAKTVMASNLHKSSDLNIGVL
jgi:hypothetical protein